MLPAGFLLYSLVPNCLISHYHPVRFTLLSILLLLIVLSSLLYILLSIVLLILLYILLFIILPTFLFIRFGVPFTILLRVVETIEIMRLRVD